MSSIINIRVPVRLKRAAKKIAEANGLDLSSCIRMFLVHMEIRGTVPLPRLTVNGFTEEEEDEILRRAKEEPRIPVDDLDEYFRKFA